MAKPSKQSKDLAKLLPFKQQLAMEMEPKLKRLVQDFPRVAYCMDDLDLSENIGDLLEKLGFQGQRVSSGDIKASFYPLLKAFREGQLILLNYRKKVDGSTSVSLLTELKSNEPTRPLASVIPIFFAAMSPDREREVLQLMGQLDVQYVIYIPPTSTTEMKLQKVFEELERFQHSVLEKRELEKAAEPELTPDETDQKDVILKYKDLLKRADDLVGSDPEKAIALFTEAIALKPDFTVMMKRGDAYFKQKEYVPALKDYQEANKLEKEKADPYSKIGMCCFALVRQTAGTGQKDLAKKWFAHGMNALKQAEAIIEEMEKSKDFLLDYSPKEPYRNVVSALSEADFRGFGLEEEEEKISALMDHVFLKTKDLDFSSGEVDYTSRIDYAILLTRRKQYQEAEQIFRAVIKEDPKNAGPAFNNFAVELRKNGEFGKAFHIYIEVLRFDVPDRNVVVKNLITAGHRYAQMVKKTGNFDEAINACKNILMYASDSEGREWVLCDMADAYLAKNDPLQASTRLMEALFLNPHLTETKEFELYPELKRLREEMVKKLTQSSE